MIEKQLFTNNKSYGLNKCIIIYNEILKLIIPEKKIQNTFEICLINIIVFVLSAWLALQIFNLNSMQNYWNFYVGYITWANLNKSNDLFAIYSFILSYPLFYAVISRIYLVYKANLGVIADEIITNMCFWSLIAIVPIIHLLIDKKFDFIYIKTTALVLIYQIFAYILLFITRKSQTARFVNTISVNCLSISLTSLSLILLLGRLGINIENLSQYMSYEYTYIILKYLLLFNFIILFLPIDLKNFVSYYSFIAQVGLSLFIVVLIPAKLIQANGSTVVYSFSLFLPVLVVIFFLAALCDIYIRFKISLIYNKRKYLYSPLPFFALLIALRVGVTNVPIIHNDDYHVGEISVGGWSYLNGYLPYIDYFPPHGIIDDDLMQIVSYIFFDGTASTISESARISFLLVGLLAYLSIYQATKSIPISFISVGMFTGRLGWLFMTFFSAIFYNSRIIKKPIVWLTAFILSFPLLILGVPSQGLMLYLSILIIALIQIYKIYHSFPNLKQISKSKVISVILLIVVSYSFCGRFLYECVKYVYDNSSVNTVAYGIPWNISWRDSSTLFFEIIRTSWIFSLMLSIFILNKIIRTKGLIKVETASILSIAIFIIMFVPYSMGRIDPGNFSRQGMVSNLIWAIMLPLATFGVINKFSYVLVLISGVIFSSTLGQALPFIDLSNVANNKILSPNLIDYSKKGFENIGLAYLSNEHFNRLEKISYLLRSQTINKEKYIDLTSRNANYFYMNRLPPTRTTAMYNTVPINQQIDSVNSLKNYKPKLALMEAENINHDGGGLGLRNPLIYKYIIKNYTPHYNNGLIYGVLNESRGMEPSYNWLLAIKSNLNNLSELFIKDRIEFSDPYVGLVLHQGDEIDFGNGVKRLIKEINNQDSYILLNQPIDKSFKIFEGAIQFSTNNSIFEKYSAILFYKSFSTNEFQRIPIAWGGSYKNLNKKLSENEGVIVDKVYYHDIKNNSGILSIDGKDPSVYYILQHPIDGFDADIIEIDFECHNPIGEPRLQVYWESENNESLSELFSFKFAASYSGKLLIPAGSNALWSLSKKIRSLRVDLDNSEACQAIKIANLKVAKRL